ncbi:MAG TPA: hypothetical protein VKZ84_05970, partial [Bacteriovoracaceae bacterium]|nr:hypothetical protein [Bacteriovoracaceae bacterium]
QKSRNSQFVVGLSYLDIGNTEFKSEKPELNISDIQGQLNLGVAFGQRFNLFHYILSADLKHLNRDLEFRQRLKTGIEVGIPGLSLLAGVNGGYYSYGAKVDLGLMSLMAGFYDLELGHHYKQVKSRRMIIYLSLFDFSFDV